MGLQPRSLLSIASGSNVASTLPTITVPFTFTMDNQTAANIEFGQFLLSNTSGNTIQNPLYCYGAWATGDLKLYDASPAETTLPNQPLADSFCTVSLVSVANVTNPTSGIQATVNFTFTPAAQGLTYNIFHEAYYDAGADPWENVGTLTIQTPPAQNPLPTVTLLDNTQQSGTYVVGDHFTLTVTGQAGLPVSVSINGVDYGVQGYTTGGVYTVSSSWTSPGSFTEVWYVNGAAVTPSSLSFLVAPDFNPPSIPNSYTGSAPVLPCTDVTGNWIATPSSGPISEWDLTQTGTSASGSAYVSYAPGCTVTTYQVNGSVSNGQFAITASSPQPAIDNACNIQFTTTDTHYITLSGNSCSVGTGTYSTGSGGGSITWNAKTTRNTATPTTTPTTAHYRIEYAGYIPVDNVTAKPCSVPFMPFNWLVYKGDAYRGTARVQQAWIVIPGAQHSYNFWANTGPTRNYAPPSPQGPKDANGNNTLLSALIPGDDPYGENSYSGADEDMQRNDCFVWNAAGHASTANMQQAGSPAFSPPTTTVTFGGLGSNPLEQFSPPIDWSLNVVINESNPGAPTAYVSGYHTCYPAHIVKVNGTAIYSFQPAANNMQTIGGCLAQIYAPITVQGPTVQVGTQ